MSNYKIYRTPFYNRTTKKTFIQWLRSYKTVEADRIKLQDFKDFEKTLLNQ